MLDLVAVPASVALYAVRGAFGDAKNCCDISEAGPRVMRDA
jgi:hypothetical protein